MNAWKTMEGVHKFALTHLDPFYVTVSMVMNLIMMDTGVTSFTAHVVRCKERATFQMKKFY